VVNKSCFVADATTLVVPVVILALKGRAKFTPPLRGCLESESRLWTTGSSLRRAHPDDFWYRDETQSWEDAGVGLCQVISRPDGHDWSGPTGYVQTLLDHVLPDLKSPVALVCGSREMIEQTRDRLQQMGFASDAILTNLLRGKRVVAMALGLVYAAPVRQFQASGTRSSFAGQ
jgi:hypothetical protein